MSIGRDSYLKYCLPSVKVYCKKYNIDLKVISTPFYNIPYSFDYNYNTFEKNQVYHHIEGYDRILRLDSDIIINPNAPNFFELDPNNIYVTYEDVGPRKIERRFEIERLKVSLGNIQNWDEGYFNSGVILFSQRHKEIFNLNLQDLKKDLGPFKEQSYLNWKVKSLGFELVNLGKDFNHIRSFEEDWSNSNRLHANIIHYAGPQHSKEKKMSEDFKFFYPNLSKHIKTKSSIKIKNHKIFILLKRIIRKIIRKISGTKIKNIPSIRRDNGNRRKSFMIEIKSLLPKKIISLEIGVAAGDFSEKIMDSLNIIEHHIVDPWLNDGDQMRSQWFNEDNPAEASFQFVKERFKNKPVKIFRDFSYNYLLNEISQKNQYDFIYVDGDHHSEAVYLDLVLGWQILKYDGIISGDDYNWISKTTKREEVKLGVKKFEETVGVKASIIKGDDNGLDQFYFIKNRI